MGLTVRLLACVVATWLAASSALADRAPSNLADIMRSVVSVLPEWPLSSFNASEPEGSGVAVLDGHIVVTAYHVVEKALSVRVRTSNGDIVPATVVAGDKVSDIAIVRIEDALPPLAFGGDAAIGDTACAIGNAFGLGLSVTCGHVSAIHRAGTGFNAVEDFVQTDAAVNPGASGGALVDADGALIGILSAIFTKTSDANIGVNFAVSAPLAGRIARTLLRDGKMTWNFGGAALGTHPPAGTVGRMAALVIRLRQGGAAEAAGLIEGDRIVMVGARRVRTPDDFRSALARLDEGATVDLTVERGETVLTLPFTMR